MIRNSLFSLFIILFSSVSVYAQAENGPDFKFDETKHDFGDIIQGNVVEHYFKFTNAGKEPLVISRIVTTCGCTAPTWPKEPIKAGESGKIKIVFNSTGKIGRQNKVVTILSNSVNQKEQLFIVANIIPQSGK
jgi:hypothetical protein